MGRAAKKEENVAEVREERSIDRAAATGSAELIGKAQKDKVKALGPRMYVGPTISGIGIQNRVYTEIPQDAKEKAKEMPEISQLFIPVKNYPVANQMLREKKGYIYSAFCKVGALRNGGNEA